MDVSTWMFYKYCKPSMVKTEVSSWRGSGLVGLSDGRTGLKLNLFAKPIYFFNNYLRCLIYARINARHWEYHDAQVKVILSALPKFIVWGENNTEPAVPCVMDVYEMYRSPWEHVRGDLGWSASQERCPWRSSYLDRLPMDEFISVE